MSKTKYLYFYDHYNDRQNTNETCFSNYYPSFIKQDKIIFFNAEQHFMYYKALHFKDNETAKAIYITLNYRFNVIPRSPQKIRDLGKKVKNFNYKEWEKIKYVMMYRTIRLKFLQNFNLKCFLLSTKDFILVNADPLDTIWGTGMSRNDLVNVDESQWKGDNLLGKVLMNLRKHLG